MTQHIDTIRQFYSMLTGPELAVLRHDAIRLHDHVSKELIDEELKRRVGENRAIHDAPMSGRKDDD